MATGKTETEDVPCCPICLEEFIIPRQLPCAHSFCEKCLQSHITAEATKHMKLRDTKCPVCRNSANPSIKDRPTSEWASLFPVNTVLQSVVTTKSKVDRICHACYTQGTTAPAEGFCVVCKEAMCGDCLKFHRKQTLSKDHTILNVEELECNPENVMKLAEGFTCLEHHGEDIKYYCKDHKVPCCGTCFFKGHKLCSKVIDLKEELTDLLHEVKPVEMIADMKKIESHLKKFMEINESSVNSLEKQVNGLIIEMRNVRKKINDVLDEFEKHMETEVNRIYKEEVIRKQEENHQCLSLIHAVRNSHYLLQAVDKYGSNLQKFLMLEKMKSQLHSYCNLVGEKYEKTETTRLEVEFALPIHSMLSHSLSEFGKVATTIRSNTLPLICFSRPKKDCQIQTLDLIELQVPTDYTLQCYGVTFLPGDRVMLADYNNNQCILLSSSYQFITSHTLTSKPWNICVLDDQEVAVSLYNRNYIQILSVIGDVIRPVRTIETKYICSGIAAAGKGKMVVNGYFGNKKSQWSLINMRGDVKCSHQYDSLDYSNSYIALNNMKTRVYVSVYGMNSLLCFDMEGRKHFTYSPKNLRRPYGVAVDRYDNIYVVSYMSGNIHQLSADGSLTQVITSGVPKYPMAIVIHMSADMFIITNLSYGTKLHIYQLKYN
ncbi:hypothetical protein CHS0354_001365 [Potamilus streckersoni]|uniref:RING-type domain-containing protein n=1 Tax=Potamilus streckersoni TaxID=2493646 RepID=A0AAE0WCR4_9BIVA|nr:hypothetical protein CHS0354_001365 [Potamilus streckersoni]